VVLIEDNDDARSTLQLALELAGHTVFAVSNGTAAVEVASEFAPDVSLA
jgi:DNA-binding response OmpR family regulator